MRAVVVLGAEISGASLRAQWDRAATPPDRVQLAACLAGGVAIAATAPLRGVDTFGRWPYLAAAAAPAATLIAVRSRAWSESPWGPSVSASVPLLLWHQTEEWVAPGGFLRWFNRSVWQSGEDEFPVTPGMAFRINVLAGWGVSALALRTLRSAPWLAAGLLTSHAANAALHGQRAFVERGYNPGVATATVMGPLGLIGVAAILRDPGGPRRGALVGVLGGLALSAALPIGMRLRVRRRQIKPLQSEAAA